MPAFKEITKELRKEFRKDRSKKRNKEEATKKAVNNYRSKNPVKAVGTTKHQYDISLIGALENDHAEILMLYRKVLRKAGEGDLASLQQTLVEFSTAFTSHIQVEDEEFYGYMKTLASTKSAFEQKVVAECYSEMKNISISIFSFLSQSPYMPVSYDNLEGFKAEFKQIGALLEDRIKREETFLYPIYKNSRKVVNIS